MAKAVTLKNNNDEEVYPVTSLALAVGSVSTAKIGNRAVTAAKIDFSTIGALNYSTSEAATGGTWVDGKPIYKKTINVGALPNAADKAVAHGIRNLGMVVKLEGVATNGTYYYNLPLVYQGSDSNYNVELYATSTAVGVKANTNRSMFTSSYVTIYYTKS